MDTQTYAEWTREWDRLNFAMPGMNATWQESIVSGLPYIVVTHRTKDSLGSGRTVEVTVTHTFDRFEAPPTAERMAVVVRNLARSLIVHEIDEWLKVDGHLVNDPHRAGQQVDS